ncbi:hypothetical protein RY831_03770 [Noviherbaspirillum sp. CPCC 100848]|uniref:Uncharacterized protein n=1 Tax=Noviherbaspirillum album TaxID=3080276 RepID=A0ABU6J3Q0_9BURK|nr:hypothetical protein [Noviherbaspirillum sp. CPCC 100848]MEC4718252.1 hypothetical protein [Noviherbaspirillum sp. CPCC 100848]
MSTDPSIVGSFEPLTRSIDGPFTSVVVVGFDSVTDVIQSLAECSKPVLPTHIDYLVEAIELEREYLWHRIDFRSPAAPPYPELTSSELKWVGDLFGIENAICVVVANNQGDIAIGRSYFCTEQTRLERAYEKLMVHADALRMLAPPGTTRF